MFSRTVFIITAWILSVLPASGQISARARIYDRGLVSLAEPFSPTGNPALLSARDYLRFNVEHYRDVTGGYQISLSYPISSRTGIGLAWRRLGFDRSETAGQGLEDRTLQKQDFIISLGHRIGVQWGQMLELNYENFRQRTWGRELSVPSPDYQKIQVRYRIGVLQPVGNSWTIGIMTPPLFAYRYRTDSAVTVRRFAKELDQSVSIPLVCVEWHPSERWGFAAGNRSEEGHGDIQFAFQLRQPRWDLLQAVKYDDHERKWQVLSGIGLWLQGFHVFAGYNFSGESWGISVSFAPERMRTLVRVSDIRMSAYQLYPYRLALGQPACLAEVGIERVSDQPVELTLVCSGEDLPSVTQSVSLKDSDYLVIQVPVPPQFRKLPPGRYRYRLELNAYSKGKQTLTREISFEMKGTHDWSGDPGDLVYFLRPQHQPVVDRSRKLIAFESAASEIPHERTASRFYRFIRDSIQCVPDPRPLTSRSDRGQYPSELLATRAGDCEDQSILMISMLESVGIDAAFAEYVRPDTDEGHIFVLFDSGKTATQLLTEGKNLQKYIVRARKDSGESRYFIPLELMRHDLSFEEAWVLALKTYMTFAVEQNGLADGWFHIIDARPK